MAKTVIVNPSGNNDSGIGFFLGIVLLIAFVLVLLYYGIPYVRNVVNQDSGTQINVPEQIDVNVYQDP